MLSFFVILSLHPRQTLLFVALSALFARSFAPEQRLSPFLSTLLRTLAVHPPPLWRAKHRGCLPAAAGHQERNSRSGNLQQQSSFTNPFVSHTYRRPIPQPL